MNHVFHITWDAAYFSSSTLNASGAQVLLSLLPSAQQQQQDLVLSATDVLLTSDGIAQLTPPPGHLAPSADASLAVQLSLRVPAANSTDGDARVIEGPTLHLAHSLPYVHRAHEHALHRRLAIGLPIGLVALLLLLGLALWWERRRRATGKAPLFGLLGRGRGYGERKGYAQRVGGGEAAAPVTASARVDDAGVQRRGSAQVEHGVELETQRLRPGFARQATDAGDPFADPAPAAPASAAAMQPGGRANVFREEIERQRAGRPLQ